MQEIEKQASDSFAIGLILALSAGCQDAYTYVMRGKIFANAQTGNIIMMSHCLVLGDFRDVFKYALPIAAFGTGIFFTEQVGGNLKQMSSIHWRQIIVFLEIITLLLVGLLPQSYNLVASLMVSVVCALQVQAFRHADGNVYVTTMCVGNLRSGTAALSEFFRTKDREKLKKVGFYYTIIFAFASGAAISMFFTKYLAMKTIWISCFLLLISFILMMPKKSEKKCV
ncbi:MAG: YoaK family protein [Eubacteriales bacterium]